MNKTRPKMVIIVLKPSFVFLQREKFYNISALLHNHSHNHNFNSFKSVAAIWEKGLFNF